jgi:hypothetical protein
VSEEGQCLLAMYTERVVEYVKLNFEHSSRQNIITFRRHSPSRNKDSHRGWRLFRLQTLEWQFSKHAAITFYDIHRSRHQVVSLKCQDIQENIFFTDIIGIQGVGCLSYCLSYPNTDLTYCCCVLFSQTKKLWRSSRCFTIVTSTREEMQGINLSRSIKIAAPSSY